MSDPAEPTVFAGAPDPRARDRAATLVAGDLLNGIYRVDRFIARGGMGEVFEGVNVETEERVAIKAIRSHLASDPGVVALFRKEARVLTQFAHPAIVQYRVFARDPVLDLPYIVTDFIDGAPITAHLDGQPRALAEVVMLARRLAAGLEVAHDHGAIHRDMAPDNVLLPDGRLERAKIIDFGIAKSLTPTTETVVGDGFAGKLGYVAPEQFGDFGRQIGPWTDVYSMALVLLAVARGRAPAMGTTLSEAVERRRLGLAVTDLPVALAPVLERMLVPDPAARLRSMREVLAGLDAIRLPDARAITPAPRRVVAPAPPAAPSVTAAVDAPTTFMPVVAPSPAPRTPLSRWRGTGRWGWVPLVAGAAVAGGAWLQRPAPPERAAPRPTVAPPAPRAAAASAAVAPAPAPDRVTRAAALLDALPCTWASATFDARGDATLAGATADPAALAARLGRPGTIDASRLAALAPAQCAALAALRPYRVPGAARLRFTPRTRADCPGGAILVAAPARRDTALLALDPGGRLRALGGARGRYCVAAGGIAGFFLVEGAPVGIATRDGALVRDWRARLAAAPRAPRVTAAFVRVDPAPAVAPAVLGAMLDPAAAPLPAPARGDDTADANRHERDRLERLRSETGPDVAACQTFDGRWRAIGHLSLRSCVAEALASRCTATFAQHGAVMFRRNGRYLQQQRGTAWRNLARDRCDR
ncbi:serine/threonine-protein kinase [Sphingomonas sp. BK235]|uniref:serine/threonine-protein kinase n=1 Tax=Sphingomonas sp. BK235 TaxID=2512131 RepID=UPI0010EC2FFF|nr:serine/threonine-protein kinase [Sphingomonas sp. BK235]TCP33700.1 serine/threonine-protein kinase [Sphingomonas sp. BK235]